MRIKTQIGGVQFYCLKLVVGFTYVENHEDANELGEAEGHTKFERGESRDHSSATLPAKMQNINQDRRSCHEETFFESVTSEYLFVSLFPKAFDHSNFDPTSRPGL